MCEAIKSLSMYLKNKWLKALVFCYTRMILLTTRTTFLNVPTCFCNSCCYYSIIPKQCRDQFHGNPLTAAAAAPADAATAAAIGEVRGICFLRAGSIDGDALGGGGEAVTASGLYDGSCGADC